MAEEGRGRIWHTKSANNNLSDDSSSGVETTRDDEASGSGLGSGSGSGSGSKSGTINVHNPAVSYGGIDPEIEENVLLVKSVPAHDVRWDATDHRRNPLDPDLDDDLDTAVKRRTVSASTSRDSSPAKSFSSSPPERTPLLDLPSELIDAILSWLTPLELAAVSLVCRVLRNHANSDSQWKRHVLSNLPVNRITTPYPCKSWRELYISHDPYWFLTKHKLWFCDRELTGQMIIVRYDERRGCIEGYQLVSTRNKEGSEPWLADQDVHIHHFEPSVKLHLDKPILQLNVDSLENLMRSKSSSLASRHFYSEQPMRINNGTDPRFTNFLLAKPLNKPALAGRMANEFPHGYVWPPPAIPARHRVTGQPAGVHPLATSIDYTRSTSGMWQPRNRSEASDQIFRIRQWMEMGPPTLGVHFAEEVVTYSTLDPFLYTPTAERPWRGIWVGDYSGHGCEFLLINQPDDDVDKGPLARLQNETEAEFQERFLHERVYRGRLEAIKLTGDANVPRGEYTFVADDLGEDGFIGTAREPPFEGSRVVKSKGHIAHMGFYNDRYIESQLLLLSHNRLAQYWVGFGHISFFERVDIDQFLVPK
ncbi:F-box domain-containing protein [Annulohypoxylon truncatum]|uniref:F-box domain-containing protein n=1 Tax=Annulohypoxylon truncatum TaxID=327061 RepID=UPI0020084D68|nr:F-box domain-containing protein [Annulohypoxylon truncatum]KAI1209306.1 F-box domain-containing protein [Annulohypoxylon truncatum]